MWHIGVAHDGEERRGLIPFLVDHLSTCLGLQDTYSLDETVLYKNNPQVSVSRVLPCLPLPPSLPTTLSSQINNECTNIYLGQVLCVASKSYPYILPTNITEPTSAGEEPVTSTVLPTNVPTTGPEPAAITMTESVWATVTSDAAGAVSTAAASQVS